MRKNLEGHEFKTVIGHWKPFTYDIAPIREDGSLVTSASGYVMDIISNMQKELNFSMKMIYTKGWSNMVDKVNRKEADFACTGFSLTLKRSKLVDFSFPLASTSLRMFYARDPSAVNWKLYFYSFRTDSWIGFILAFVISTLLFGLITYLTNYSLTSSTVNFSMLQSLSFVIFSQIGKRFPQEPKLISLRTGFFTISLIGFFLISIYKAMLGASLAIKVFKDPITDLHELLDRNDLDLIVSGTSSVKDYFKDAKPGSYQHQLWLNKLNNTPVNLIKNDETGMKEIATGIRSNAILLAIYEVRLGILQTCNNFQNFFEN